MTAKRRDPVFPQLERIGQQQPRGHSQWSRRREFTGRYAERKPLDQVFRDEIAGIVEEEDL